MTSFKIGGLSAKDRASGRFIERFNRAIATAAVKQKRARGLTQRSVAEAMDVDKAFVSRILAGGGNPTLRTIGELAWAMGLRPNITFEPIEDLAHNHVIEPIKVVTATSPQRPAVSSQMATNTSRYVSIMPELTDA